MNFAIVGCGRISGKHVDAIESIKDAKLIACSDTDIEKAQAISKRTGCAAYSDYHEMLDRHQDIEVISVLTPSGLHAIHAIDIAKTYRKHIVVEKPMALQLSDADEMIRVCDEAGVRLFVVKQNRFNLQLLGLEKL